jgi:hypothetical protein
MVMVTRSFREVGASPRGPHLDHPLRGREMVEMVEMVEMG